MDHAQDRDGRDRRAAADVRRADDRSRRRRRGAEREGPSARERQSDGRVLRGQARARGARWLVRLSAHGRSRPAGDHRLRVSRQRGTAAVVRHPRRRRDDRERYARVPPDRAARSRVRGARGADARQEHDHSEVPGAGRRHGRRAHRRPHGHSLTRRIVSTLIVALAAGAWPSAQPVFSGTDIFPPEEVSARRAKGIERIGDRVAILQGATERPGEQPFRQNNQFFYLTGVVEPRAIAVVDGRSKQTKVFLQPVHDRREQRMFGPGLHPGAEAAKATGLDAILAREEFAHALSELTADGRAIYTPFRAEVLGEASSGDAVGLARATRSDPWDGRESREEAFVAKLKAAAPRSEIRDLDPIVDALRSIKSPREIAIIREATNITGLAILEAMKDAKPGMFEYELQADAELIFKRHGAYGGS